MNMDKEKTFEVDLYIKDTPPLKDEEFAVMLAHDNDEMSIDDLNFEEKKFNALEYCRVN